MKLFFSVVLTTILFTGTMSAQHFNIGIKGGLNLYNINNDNGPSNDAKVGYHVGIINHFHLGPQWAAQPEVSFSAQGAKNSIGGLDTKLKLGYINIPVMIQYMFDNGFRLQAGPQVGFLVAANSSVNDNDTDIKSNFKTVEFGLGAGFGYVNPATGFGVDLRYVHGLSDINENSSTISTNRGVQLGLFYLFGHE